jgi:hypothetical protein
VGREVGREIEKMWVVRAEVDERDGDVVGGFVLVGRA